MEPSVEPTIESKLVLDESVRLAMERFPLPLPSFDPLPLPSAEPSPSPLPSPLPVLPVMEPRVEPTTESMVSRLEEEDEVSDVRGMTSAEVVRERRKMVRRDVVFIAAGGFRLERRLVVAVDGRREVEVDR